MTNRHCCYLEGGKDRCETPAEWELHGSSHPLEPTDACTAHVGALLDDSSETKVVAIHSLIQRSR